MVLAFDRNPPRLQVSQFGFIHTITEPKRSAYSVHLKSWQNTTARRIELDDPFIQRRRVVHP